MRKNNLKQYGVKYMGLCLAGSQGSSHSHKLQLCLAFSVLVQVLDAFIKHETSRACENLVYIKKNKKKLQKKTQPNNNNNN